MAASSKSGSGNKGPKEKQQLQMSEAVVEGKGDHDDGEISLPHDINEPSQPLSPEEKAQLEKRLQTETIEAGSTKVVGAISNLASA